LLIKRGSLPVIFLRNREVQRKYLNKIPKTFIEKYRLLVFDENISGDYLVACEKPDSPLTKKILNYIKKENKVTLEIFAASKEDIDYILENYDHNSSFHVEPLHEDKVEEDVKKEPEDNTDIGSKLPLFSSLSDLLFKSDVPGLTVDSITPKIQTTDDGKDERSKNNFQNTSKKRIIINKPTNTVGQLSVSLVGKVHKEYLTKLPKEFIRKYRIVVFGENSSGELMLASDDLNAELTKKAIDFIKKQHPVELYATSTDDVEYAVNIY